MPAAAFTYDGCSLVDFSDLFIFAPRPDRLDRRRMMTQYTATVEKRFTSPGPPPTALPPPRLGELTPSDDDPGRGSRASIPYSLFTSPFNTSGQPAISLPLGSSDGLPVGVQLVAAYGREDRLMSVGGQLERTVEWSPARAASPA